MKLTETSLLSLLFLITVQAQGIPKGPSIACAHECLGPLVGNACPVGDQKCWCTNKKIDDAYRQCVPEKCAGKEKDIKDTMDHHVEVCSANGVDFHFP